MTDLQEPAESKEEDVKETETQESEQKKSNYGASWSLVQSHKGELVILVLDNAFRGPRWAKVIQGLLKVWSEVVIKNTEHPPAKAGGLRAS